MNPVGLARRDGTASKAAAVAATAHRPATGEEAGKVRVESRAATKHLDAASFSSSFRNRDSFRLPSWNATRRAEPNEGDMCFQRSRSISSVRRKPAEAIPALSPFLLLVGKDAREAGRHLAESRIACCTTAAEWPR